MLKLSLWITIPAVAAYFVSSDYMAFDSVLLFFVLAVVALVCATLPWVCGKTATDRSAADRQTPRGR
jgi:hypothetical protein